MAEVAFDLILENLKKLTNCKVDLIRSEKDQIEFLYGELEFLRTFIMDWEGKPYENGKANNVLMKQIIDVANKAEDAIELFITNKEKNHMMMGDPDLAEENHHGIADYGWLVDDSSDEDVDLDVDYEEWINEYADLDMDYEEWINWINEYADLDLDYEKWINEYADLDVDYEEWINEYADLDVDYEEWINEYADLAVGYDEGIDEYADLALNPVEAMEREMVDYEERINEDVDLALNLCGINKEIEAIKGAIVDGYEEKINEENRVKSIGMAKKIGQTEFEDIKIEELEIYNDKKHTHNIGAIQDGESSNRDLSRANTFLVGEEEVVVGFDDEAIMITDQLTGGQKQLEVISIVGMPGIGKTTLARKVYSDPLIKYHFYIRAWICVSQEYQTQDLLRSLLSSVIQDTDKISNEKLGEELRRRLKGKRYLIVMDDMWDTGAWVHLKSSFPNDKNGSRIILTSRIEDVALQVKLKPDCHPLFLRNLSENESWELFQRKAFQRHTCPPDLMEIGKEIAKKCQGLPLTIVVAAGILANKDKTLDQWKQVGKALSSSIVDHDPKLCMETLALSYNHLPRHLKPCFLYFGALPEDYEIPFHKLICLWIAEGFIREIGNNVLLEDLAEKYLLDLIGRSLVTVSKRRSDGGIKACRMHDLLRDFCRKKAEEEYFLRPITGELFPCPFPKHFLNFRRLCIRPPISHVGSSIRSTLYAHSHSLLCIASRNIDLPLHFIYRCFTLLRVLDTSSILIYSYDFISYLERLVLLRYLALGKVFARCMDNRQRSLQCGYNIPASIFKLINLETLILRASYPFLELPHSIWKMVKLRHLWITGEGKCRIERPVGNAKGYPSSLDSLHTLSCVDPLSCQDILTRTPNLRKLGFRGNMVSAAGLTFPDIHFLNHLKKLKLINDCFTAPGWSANFQAIKFPSSLKSLTLEMTYLKWDDISSLSKLLPNLEVLKLANDACRGSSWETCGVFPRLRFLKFQSYMIREWKLSSNDFPSLQRLVLRQCSLLKRIPSEIGDIPTLQMIEVIFCSNSAELSAKEIQEEQHGMGNDGLQIIIKSYRNMYESIWR